MSSAMHRVAPRTRTPGLGGRAVGLAESAHAGLARSRDRRPRVLGRRHVGRAPTAGCRGGVAARVGHRDRRVRPCAAGRCLVAGQRGRVPGRSLRGQHVHRDRVRRAHGGVDARGGRHRGPVAGVLVAFAPVAQADRGRARCAASARPRAPLRADPHDRLSSRTHVLREQASRRRRRGRSAEGAGGGDERSRGDLHQARPGALLEGGCPAPGVHRSLLDAADGLIAHPVV